MNKGHFNLGMNLNRDMPVAPQKDDEEDEIGLD